MNLRSVLLASAMAVLPLAAANAQAIRGLYIGGGIGANYLQNEDFTASAGGESASGSAKSAIGPAVSISLGYGFGNGFRAEVEGSWRENTNFNASSGFSSAGGTEQKAGVMVNGLYDFVTLSPMVQPYVGAGVGYQEVISPKGYISAGGSALTINSNQDKGSFAAQAILGAAFPIPAAPGLAVTAEYRFMALVGDRSYGASIGAIPATLKSTSDYNHTLLVGFRYAFGQAPAPAPVAPMPMADNGAKTFLVFFDWNKADLTARSASIVKDAADYSAKTAHTVIDVDGNTDTSGTASYNQGLSERRARTVAAELVRDGVPQDQISMHAYGDTKLLVPTGPNTREPQNRRVEIVFH
jgi:outer membrane protein OmpA-like peptidoglycan-associated protein